MANLFLSESPINQLFKPAASFYPFIFFIAWFTNLFPGLCFVFDVEESVISFTNNAGLLCPHDECCDGNAVCEFDLFEFANPNAGAMLSKFTSQYIFWH